MARSMHALSAGLGDCFSSSTERWRIHSSQSSFVDRCDDSHALRSADSSTTKPAAGSARER